jgi:predicted DNA-binding transcriptional regulator AlpA
MPSAQSKASVAPAALAPAVPVTPSEILTVEDLAAWLKVSPRQIYELSRSRSLARGRHPLPSIKIHKKMLRFRRSDVEQWLNNCATGRVQ